VPLSPREFVPGSGERPPYVRPALRQAAPASGPDRRAVQQQGTPSGSFPIRRGRLRSPVLWHSLQVGPLLAFRMSVFPSLSCPPRPMPLPPSTPWSPHPFHELSEDQILEPVRLCREPPRFLLLASGLVHLGE